MSREENAIMALKHLKRLDDYDEEVDYAIRSIKTLKCLKCKLSYELNTEIVPENVVDSQDYLNGLRRALELIETLNKELSPNS